MSDIENYFDRLRPIFTTVNDTLRELFEGREEKTIQFPALLGQIKLKMNWDDKQLRANDPIIREYVRNHPNWYVTRGAHGGIMRSTEKQKKDAIAEAKKKAKEEISAQLDAEVARKKTEASLAAPTTAADNTNIETE